MNYNVVKEGTVIKIEFGNGLTISHDFRGDNPVVIAHDCDCCAAIGRAQPCCLTTVDWHDLVMALGELGAEVWS